MAVRRFATRAFALVLLLPVAIPPARAGNVEYSFNSSAYDWTYLNSGSFAPPVSGTATPWEWTGGASKNEGGWHTRTGPEGFGVGTFLISPCYIVDGNGQDFVDFDMAHRFNFGGVSETGTTPLFALGQVQYQVNSGSWVGVSLQNFLDATTGSSGNVLPTYTTPTPGSLFDSAQPAWQGATLDFTDTQKHQPSAFRLYFTGSSFGVGSEIQFRFLMGPQQASAPPQDINWEINSVNIKGVTPCPEPGTLALAAIGGLGCLLVVRRRRSAATRTVARSAVATVVVAAIVIGYLIAAPPARADAVWNFQLTSGTWTGSWVNTLAPVSSRWTWPGTSSGTTTITGGPSPHWHILAQAVGTTSHNAYYLTSPSVSGLVDSGTGLVPAKNARISIAHDFLLRMGTNGMPITTGQVEYRLNGSGTWIGLPLAAFTNGGSVLLDSDPVFGFSPFRTLSGTTPTLKYVDQASYVAPNFVLPTGTAALQFGSPGGASFTGTTAGWPTAYVPSQAFLNASTGLPADGIRDLQLRFTNLNLGTPCSCGSFDDGWNVRFVQVEFAATTEGVPEPGALALAATGLTGVVGAVAVRRRCRHHRPSRPSESP